VRRFRRTGGRAALLVVVAAASALAGCGGTTPEEGAQIPGVGEVRTGSTAQLAQCSDWLEGTPAQRLATIGDIRAAVSQSGTVGPEPQLSDDEAYDVFEKACANDFAAGFRLYKVYLHGAAFAPLTR
jgi:hypothetical protein